MLKSALKDSNTLRVLLIGFLILLLLIPMGMVESVIFERGNLSRQATNEITASWGREQLIVGPLLTLPYLETQTEDGIWTYETTYRHIRPVNMSIEVELQTEVRHRGIYKVPVYTADVRIRGEFDLTNVAYGDFETSEFEIDEGTIQLPMGNPRAIRESVIISWDNEQISLLPHWHGKRTDLVTLAADLSLENLDRNSVHGFEIIMKLAGSHELGFISSSQDTRIDVTANWGSPGFFGIYLPAEYTIDEQHFNASWDISDLLSGPGHEHIQWVTTEWFEQASRFGFKLVQPVETYQLVTRAGKYAVLFISLSFLVYFFTEVMTRMALHPVQYLLVGGANCLFYLLLLSLAEHVAFSLAYLLSATASVMMISLYSISLLRSRSKALIMFTLLTGLYTYLFVTLRSEAYALLIGSIGLFVILGLVMYMTRNIDWHRFTADSPPSAGSNTE